MRAAKCTFRQGYRTSSATQEGYVVHGMDLAYISLLVPALAFTASLIFALGIFSQGDIFSY